MPSYRAIYVMEDDSEENWLPYERSVVAWHTVPGDPESDLEAHRVDHEAAMVLTGDIGDDRLIAASSLAGFVALVDSNTPVHEIVMLCRHYVADLFANAEEDGGIGDLIVPKEPKTSHGPN